MATCFDSVLSDQVFIQIGELTSTMKTPRFILALFLFIVALAKAENCKIKAEDVLNGTIVKMDGSDCETFNSEPCETTENIEELELSRNKITEIKHTMFTCLKKLKRLYLDKNFIKSIHDDAFSNLSHLEELKLRENRISSVSPGIFKGLTSLKKLFLGHNSITQIKENTFSHLKSLENLELNNNSLQEIADGAFDQLKLATLNLNFNHLEGLPVFKDSDSLISILQISNNPVKILDTKTLGKYHELGELDLKNTHITLIPDGVFINNTKLHKLYLGESRLTDIRQKAFQGTRLRSLDLQGTQITYLPGDDLEGLKILVIKGAKALWEIPIVSFKRLTRASVEYPFHCCLIKAEKDAFAEVSTLPSSQPRGPSAKICVNGTTTTSVPPTRSTTSGWDIPIAKNSKRPNKVITLPPDACLNPDKVVNTPSVDSLENLTCTPLNDAFNPCGDLLDSNALRACSWFVLVFAILGNSFQLFVLLLSKRKISIAKILMCNLAFANLCMGMFLLMIASADLYSLGEYQNFAYNWQYRNGCKIAGFVSIFSTELAVFVLTIITVERYFTIVHPLKLEKHLNTKQIVVLLGVGWGFAVTMAVLPFFEVSSYQKVAICLPFEVQSAFSKVYVTFLLATNGLAFFFVLFCYGRMYCSLGGAGPATSANRVESRVAKRMAMLVITNFACWFPIALVSLIAIYGKALIGVPAAQFFLVFVYPINSFTNPYLYAIGTKHFQIDALEILSRSGVCNPAIEKLRNRLREQLETLPTSRGVTGSKISLSSSRSPQQSPRVSRRNSCNMSHRGSSYKSQNGSMKSNNNYRHTGSSRDRRSCSACNFLTIPLLHRQNYDLDKEREIADSKLSLSLENNKTQNADVSAKEVVLEGYNLLSWNKTTRRSTISNDREEVVHLEPVTTNDFNKGAEKEEEKDKEIEKADSPILQIPVVKVTTC